MGLKRIIRQPVYVAQVILAIVFLYVIHQLLKSAICLSRNSLQEVTNFDMANGTVKKRLLFLSTHALRKAPLTKATKNIRNVFRRLGYDTDGTFSSDWDLMWVAAPMTPKEARKLLKSAKSHQKVSNIPGIMQIVIKSQLQTQNAPYMPKTFHLPQEKTKLAVYHDSHPDSVFLTKRSGHKGKGVRPANLSDIFQSGSTERYMVEELMPKPFLIDGHKTEFAVYVAITSVNPLRVYMETSEFLIRMCPEKYYPFDSEVPQKYINANPGYDFLEVWEMPSLAKMYNDENTTNKEAFYAYARNNGHSIEDMEQQMEHIIYDVFTHFERAMVIIKDHIVDPSDQKRNVFEMVRFDFVLDENATIWLIEVNRGPGLTDMDKPARRLQVERTLYTLLSLVNMASPIQRDIHKSDRGERDMRVSDRQISTFTDKCNVSDELMDCGDQETDLCLSCLTDDEKDILYQSYLEHIQRYEWRRVIPRTFENREDAKNWNPDSDKSYLSLLPSTQKMTRWFRGKCLQNDVWCK